MSSDDELYDDHFFSGIHTESYASARVIVPRVLGLTGARSVVDIGYGSGGWARALRELGVPEVVGVDGAHVPAHRREHATSFVERDLAVPLRLDRSFGLALCVEVAEHLPPERAPGLVADLTAAAPIVLFSAAVPGQGGTGHVNEQWSEYWVALFEAEGWSCRDAIRPWVRANTNVAWWYRQNLYLAVAPSVEQAYTSFPRLGAERPEHPVDFLVRPPGDVMTAPLPPPADGSDEPDDEAALPWPGNSAASVFPVEPADRDGQIDTDRSTMTATADAEGATHVPAWLADGAAARPHPPAGAAPGGPEAAGMVADGVEPGAPAGDGAEPGPASAARDGADRRPAPAAREPGGDEEPMFPEPPGWAALQRLAGRARRHFRR